MSEEKIKKTSTKKYYDNVSVGKRTKQAVYLCEANDKAGMFEHYIKTGEKKQSVVVARSKRRADELSAYLKGKNITAAAIHGNSRAEQVEEAAKTFNAGELNILITTDMILHSLELQNIQRVVNYDLPSVHEDYFSRLILVDGAGESISFVSPEEEGFLGIIEMRLKNVIPQEELEGFTPIGSDEVAHPLKEKKKKPRHPKKKTKTATKKVDD